MNFTERTESGDFLRLDNVSYQYPSSATSIFDSINISISRGSVTAIVGPSGSGKSTLLKIIGGILAPSHGTVQINYRGGGGIGYSPQSAALLPWLSLKENLLLLADLRRAEVSPEGRVKLLNFVGLSGLQNAKPSELSGGMQTRASLARSLAGSPELLLMDEPFSNLDEITAEKIIFDLSTYFQKDKPTVLFVSHNIAQAVMLADTILVVSGSPMKVVDTIAVRLPSSRSKNVLETSDFTKTVSEVRHSLTKAL